MIERLVVGWTSDQGSIPSDFCLFFPPLLTSLDIEKHLYSITVHHYNKNLYKMNVDVEISGEKST